LRWPIGRAGDWCRDVAGLVLRVRWFPVPAGGDLRWRSAGTCAADCPAATSGKLLAERGVTVGHLTIYRWVQRFAPGFIEAARPTRHAPGTAGLPAGPPGKSPAGGPIGTGRWISMARSSMSCCRPAVTCLRASSQAVLTCCGTVAMPQCHSLSTRSAHGSQRSRISSAVAPGTSPAGHFSLTGRLGGA